MPPLQSFIENAHLKAKQNDLKGAIKLTLKHLKASPQDTKAQFFIAQLYLADKNFKKAIYILEKLYQKSQNVTVYCTFLKACLLSEEEKRGDDLLKEIGKYAPQVIVPSYDLLKQLARDGEIVAALRLAKALLVINPKDQSLLQAIQDFHFALVDTALAYRQSNTALQHLVEGYNTIKHTQKSIDFFAQKITAFSFHEKNADVLDILCHIMRIPEIDIRIFSKSIIKLIAFDLESEELDEDLQNDTVSPAVYLRILQHDDIHYLLKNDIFTHAAFEKIFTTLRKSLLIKATSLSLAQEELNFIHALAIQCYRNDYMYGIEEKEVEILTRYQDQKFHDNALTDRETYQILCALSLYRPLVQLGVFSDQTLTTIESPSLKELLRITYQDPLQEQEIEKHIQTLNTSDNAISQLVSAQYEESPYPKWSRCFKVAPLDLNQKIKHMNPVAKPHKINKILIAGCGTGSHAYHVARRFPDAQITAIDLSRRSIAYAKRMFAESSLQNTTFYQADILKLSQMDEKFDLIECAGVLHHLENPFSGWQQLKAILNPNGVMKIALYSQESRKSLDPLIALCNIDPKKTNPEEIRHARLTINQLPIDDPRLIPVVENREYYSLSSCRDLLFHANEHRYTPSLIEKQLADLNLTFLGFDLHKPHVMHLYRTLFKDDPYMSNLQNWAKFEQKNPTTFNGMYIFYCQAL